MSRAHLVPFALAFLGAILAGAHNLGIAALCASSVAVLALRRVSRNQRLSVVVAVASGLFVTQFRESAEPPATGAHTMRFSATLVEARAIDVERDVVTLRLTDGTLASAALPLPLPAIGSRLVVFVSQRIASEDGGVPIGRLQCKQKPGEIKARQSTLHATLHVATYIMALAPVLK